MADRFSFLSNTTPEYVDNLYRAYQQNPDSVAPEWQRFFDGFDFALSQYGEEGLTTTEAGSNTAPKEINVLNLINDYRSRGHLFTKTNPVRERRKYFPKLDLEVFGLAESDLDTVFQAGTDVGLGPAKLRDILSLLEQTYCQSIGAEYNYIRRHEIRDWLKHKMESTRNQADFSIEKKRHLLHKLNQAVIFEKFLGTKYVGQKRFSAEGAETIIPALDAIIEKGASLGIEEFVIGMAHRGRLNVLANILNKEYDEIFSEFEGKEHADSVFQGDVKYHLGYSADVETSENKEVHLSLMPNPSHLEAVNPVVQGSARAKIDRKYEQDESKLAPILIHGDAAIAAQGVVYEVIQMSLLEGYRTGGTIHIVINNQVGFTTNYIDGRSSTYCTDVGKVTQSPVFHVNGDDVEAVVVAIEMAMEFRQTFHRDVFIDLLCYRRHGHNEADEPAFTQPLLYQTIRKHPDPRKIYFEKLLKAGKVEAKMARELEKEFKAELQRELEEARAKKHLEIAPYLKGTWEGIRRVRESDFDVPSPDTSLEPKVVHEILQKAHAIPDDFNAHKKIRKIFSDRLKMVEENRLDWALGELLAYGSLLVEGRPVRLSGQDVRRGTFAHRHSVLVDVTAEHDYTPLNHISPGEQENFVAYNSLLSEYGVLGFEYGYTLANPNNVVIWEAQFGDFANGAQIMMDQYISSSETKWQRMSGLIQLLPHGFEGQGPEHSSARIERYLELCAEFNMQVVNFTTPASLFHGIRRQFHREFRIPMVVFSPKKLLRYPRCVSPIEDFTTGGFQEIIDDPAVDPKGVQRVLFCSGKVYYDLLEYQEQEKRQDVAIVRFEQLYPIAHFQLKEIRERYPEAEYCWVQEEPLNQGPWSFMLRHLRDWNLKPIGREPSSSPATGYYRQHAAQQDEIVREAFGEVKEKVGA
jgi:2-oxoglutarate dehydrogenase E1 component